MVIERFEGNNMLPVYERVNQQGRGLPGGLKYVHRWVEANFARCFQLMECEDLKLFQKWVLHWQGTGARFEIIPVVESGQTREIVAPYLGGHEPPRSPHDASLSESHEIAPFIHRIDRRVARA
jgi:hypothetical protein